MNNNSALPYEEKWVIEFTKDLKTGEPRFLYTRYINGIQFEAYGLVTQSEALIWAAHIINGFQPPRHHPVPEEAPSGSILSEQYRRLFASPDCIRTLQNIQKNLDSLVEVSKSDHEL